MQQPSPGPFGFSSNSISAQKPGLFARMTWWTKLRLGASVVAVIVGGGFAAAKHFKSQKNVVLFENSFDEPGTLSLNGKSFGAIGPHQHVRLELDGGTYAVAFESGGKKIDDGSLSVVSSKGGFGSVGYRGVYNIGGHKGLAVITKYYGSGPKDQVKLLSEGERVVETPRVELAKIDDGFPDSVTVPESQMYAEVTRVWHVDEQKDSVGCPGF